MTRVFALLLTAAGIASVGCATTESFDGPRYSAPGAYRGPELSTPSLTGAPRIYSPAFPAGSSQR